MILPSMSATQKRTMKNDVSLSGLSLTLIVITLLFSVLAGCGISTAPVMGGGQDGGVVTGSTAGASAQNANPELARCSETLGTLSVFEDHSLPWWTIYQERLPDLGSTIPVIRLMIQQSGCFVVVERGAAMDAIKAERELTDTGETREGSDFGKGQLVAADYTMSPSVQFAEKGTGGLGAVAGAVLGKVGAVVAGGLKKNEAATTLLLIDNRSGVQISAAVGSAKNYDFGLGGGLFGSGGLAGAGGFSNTPEGKIIIASFADSFNQMVEALKNYKVQEVEGGLGKGGKLGVGQ